MFFVAGPEFAEVAETEAIECAWNGQRRLPAVVGVNQCLAEANLGGKFRPLFPLAAGVAHLDDTPSHETGTLHIDGDPAGHGAGGPRTLDAERHRLRGKEA